MAMNSPSMKFITTIFLSIFPIIPLSNGTSDEEYKMCSSLYSCGDIKDIGYPFWGCNRPVFCGLSGFVLNCSNNRDHTQIWGFVGVHSINTSSRTIVIDRRSKNETCNFLGILGQHAKPYKEIHFKPGAAARNITLFYGCSRSSITNADGSISCSDLGVDAYVHYYYSKTAEAGSNCQNVTLPVSKRALDEFLQNGNNRTFQSVLSERYEVEYDDFNFTACLACESSGGVCGSSIYSPSEFKCYHRELTVAGKRRLHLILIFALGITGGVMLMIVLVAFCYHEKLKFFCSKIIPWSISIDTNTSNVIKGSLCFDVPLFSYKDLEQATSNFNESRELGCGGFGRVFYGKLKDGREVAVKQLYEKNYRRIEQFMNEVQILTRLRHQNLVSLYGCTSPQCRELLLVYEYIRNGTVADHLHGEKTNSSYLSWHTRIRIAIETATALAYLHASDIIHRDVKTNNILLDSNFSVKVADFGLSRLFPADATHVSTAPQGSPGYLDPEYHQCYQLTVKSDVYSFGVVLIELISSLPAISMNRQKHEINLSNYAMKKIQRGAFEELVDPRLGFGSDFQVMRMTILVAELAFRCLQHDKEFRPAMDEVLEVLKKIESADHSKQLEARDEEATGHIKRMPASPIIGEEEEDGARLLISNVYHHDHHQEMPSSTSNSVMDKWGSDSTATSNTSKQSSNAFYSMSN